MKENYTHICMVLDRSGSMGHVKDDTIGSFNEFLKKQQEEEGECTFTMAQFDDRYEIVHDFIQLKKVPLLDNETFVPRGMTALLDAVGRTINATGDKLKDMNEKDRPGRIIFVILTDGHENCSREYKKAVINDMIKHQTNKYNWQFIFLGANQDAIEEAKHLGIKRGNSMTFAASGQGMHATMCSLDSAVKGYRGMSAAAYSNAAETVDAFTDEDREKQEKELSKTSTSSK